MAFHFQEDTNVELPMQKWKSVSAAAVAAASDEPNGCFDCNICLDFARDPVVTLCGHLYCWPCIYKWFYLQKTSEEQQYQQCPVCKADVSYATLVPLYGRGQSTKQDETEADCNASYPGVIIPSRPTACGVHDALITTTTSSSHRSRGSLGILPPSQQPHHRNPYQHDQQQYYPRHYSNYTEAATPGGTTTRVFGEMVYARVFGNPEVNFYSNYNYHMGSSSPRVRRQELHADKSLNRISIFLFCCFVLCLLLF